MGSLSPSCLLQKPHGFGTTRTRLLSPCSQVLSCLLPWTLVVCLVCCHGKVGRPPGGHWSKLIGSPSALPWASPASPGPLPEREINGRSYRAPTLRTVQRRVSRRCVREGPGLDPCLSLVLLPLKVSCKQLVSMGVAGEPRSGGPGRGVSTDATASPSAWDINTDP